jgi:putative acetyltransferase
MTDIIVATESPVTKEGRALVDGSEAALRAVYTPDECFTFTAEELLDETISFYVARNDGEAVGCVALVNEDNYGEVKRLYVPHKARGLGIARILMARLEADAKANGYTSVKLETGEKLTAAVELYKSLGYTICGPFGEYEDHPASLFMEKAL